MNVERAGEEEEEGKKNKYIKSGYNPSKPQKSVPGNGKASLNSSALSRFRTRNPPRP